MFWQFWSPDVVTPLLARFERENPCWKVQMEQLTWQSGREKITAAVAAGKVPDLCELGSIWMPLMLASGRLTDSSAGVGDLRPQLRGWELCSTGDKVFGVPWVMGTRALFYNKTPFVRAGLDSTRPPETWEELHQAAAAIHGLGGDVRGFGVQAGERHVLLKPVLAVVAIQSFLFPLIFVDSDRLRTLPVGLALLSQTEHRVDWGFLMAGSTVASLPVLVVFLAFQRQILSGLLAGAEK